MSNLPEGRREGGVRFRRVAVIGPGLLGGSILRAVRSRGVAIRTVLWARRAEAVREALGLGVADEAVSELGAAVRGSDLLVLCTPVGAMADLAGRIGPLLDPDAILTDVGSVKAPVVRAVAGALGDRAVRFVGSHPMAGSERSGIAASRADLFEGATCVVTPEAGLPAAVCGRVAEFWTALGARVCRLDPATHDRVMARASHLPHLLASALVNYVCRVRPDPLQFIGNGFRDTTRVASGPADLWREILSFNREEVREAVTGMISVLEEARQLLDSPDDGRLEAFLAAAKRARDGIAQGYGHGGD